MPKLNPGDRVAYAAAFLKNTGQFTGAAPQRRGTFLGVYDAMPKTHGRVRWDDQEERIAAGLGQFGEADYCEHVRAHGELAALSAIARVGSARFALNDL
jgi:hypothetical protein